MRNEKLERILKNIDLQDCYPVIDNYIYYIEKEIRTRVYRGDGSYFYDVQNFEFLVIADNNVKKAIILRFGTVDLHWLVLKPWRNQQVLSNALRTDVLAKIWPENKTVTCCYQWDDNRHDKYAMTEHLAQIAGLTMKDEPSTIISFK